MSADESECFIFRTNDLENDQPIRNMGLGKSLDLMLDTRRLHLKRGYEVRLVG